MNHLTLSEKNHLLGLAETLFYLCFGDKREFRIEERGEKVFGCSHYLECVGANLGSVFRIVDGKIFFASLGYHSEKELDFFEKLEHEFNSRKE